MSQSLEMPEIPCRYDDETLSLRAYAACVRSALDDLEQLKS